MKKHAVTLAIPAGTLVLTNPAPAQARPTGCSARLVGEYSGQATCTGGTGQFIENWRGTPGAYAREETTAREGRQARAVR